MNDQITIPVDLPISEWADELTAAIEQHQVIVVAGETGSGKSTQLPKLCLRAGRGTAGLIGHTQPRRVAARTIAERVAQEIGTKVGDVVGYTVRFNDQVGDTTAIRVMTDGILLNEIQRDRKLTAYDTLIIDEAHERSLNIDFILGFLKQLLPQRPDLRVIVTSATIDTERFAQHFADSAGNPAPIFDVEGRTYPVEIRYRPYGPDNPDDDDDDRDQIEAIIDAVDELTERDAVDGDRDILVFLSGEREIRDTAAALADANRSRGVGGRDLDILPLYSRLSAHEQHRIFQPHRGRRVVLATNIAETSITVPSVRYVIDAGTARISRYSRRLKVQRLPIEPISQASADQRAGRSGRVAPGIAIRLYPEDGFDERPEFTDPEIVRTNLASVILQMTAIGLGDVARFPFVEPPDHAQIRDGYALLDELGALKPGRIGAPRRLTDTGYKLARLPVDPRLGRMIVEAERKNCVREVLVIAAALSIQDVREWPKEHAERAAELHRRFTVQGSDLMSIVKLWDYLRDEQRSRSGNQFRRMCHDEFLHYLRVREWRDLYSQLRQVAGQLDIRPANRRDQPDAHPDRVHQAVLAGLLSHIGERQDDGREFRGARDARFMIGRGSALAKRPPEWVMATELVETNRLWAHRCAEIDPAWCEPLAEHLTKRSYGEARWDPTHGRAVTDETVTLYGCPIVANRTVGVDAVNPVVARDLFIKHALVAEDWSSRTEGLHDYRAHNGRFLQRVELLQARIRRTDLIDDEVLFEFFDSRLPSDITSGAAFEAWWTDVRNDDPTLLNLTSAVLSNRAGIRLADYPDRWRTASGEYEVTYRFEPGTPLDGASLVVPVSMLNELDTEGLTWLVPGYRRELIELLVRGLPKEIRRDLIPLADTVAAVANFLEQQYPEPTGPFTGALAEALEAACGRRVDPDLFHSDDLPSHLRFHLIVEDVHGEVIDAGDELEAIRSRQAETARATLTELAPIEERRGITEWDVGTLDPVIEQHSHAGHIVRAYPTLLDRGDSVALRVVDNPSLQARAMRGGVRRLLLMGAAPAASKITKSLSSSQQLTIAAAEFDLDELTDECIAATLDAIIARHGLPWDADAFHRIEREVRSDAPQLAADALAAAADVLEVAQRIHHRLVVLTASALEATVVDAAAHRDRLVSTGFVGRAGIARLPDLHRYLRGIEYRLDHLNGEIDRDQRRLAEIRPLEAAYARAVNRLDTPSDEVREIAWMLEELRISVFAHPIGTDGKVSAKRIRQAFLDATGETLD